LIVALAAGSVVCPSAQRASGPPATASVPLLPVELRWAQDLSESPAADATADEDRIYVAVNDGTVRAYDRASGSMTWSRELTTRWPLVRAAGDLFVLSGTTLHRLDPIEGLTRQELMLPGTPSAAMTVDGDVVLVPIEPAMLVAVNVSTGAERWRAAVQAPVGAPVTIAGSRLVVPLANGHLAALSTRDGTLLWTRALRGALTRAAIAGNRAFAGSSDRHVYAVDLDSGDLVWMSPAWAAVIGVAADARHVYVVALDNIVRGLDGGNGNVRWREVLDTRPRGAPQLVDGATLVVPGLEPALTALDARSGTRLGTHAFGERADLAVSAATPLLLAPIQRGTTTVVLFTRSAMLAFGPADAPTPVEDATKNDGASGEPVP
jgi:outer membrane protein assembly factor BamB